MSQCTVLCIAVVLLTVVTGQSVHNGDKFRESYDFIVVGAGSAGCPATNRLTEVSGWNVLLIEAGVEAVPLTDVPYVAPASQLGPQDWQYWADCGPQACLGMAGNQSFWPRGKVLGGTSVLNYMQYVRGNKKDYDGWADRLSDKEWSYDNVLEYFKKSEDCRVNPDEIDEGYHGRNGYLTTEKANPVPKLSPIFLSAAKEQGHSIRDINGKSQTGFMRTQCTTRNGGRWNTAHAFIEPILGRKNLHIVKGAQAHKVIIQKDKDGVKRAVGVIFEQNGQIFEALASKEVLLSTGAIGTPYLLLLSGVGPQEHLREVGIEPIHHSPGVGRNLQDHIAFPITFTIDDSLELSDTPARVLTTDNLLGWMTNGKGPLSNPGGVDMVGFFHSKFNKKEEDWPDLQAHPGVFSFHSFAERPPSAPFGIGEETYDRIYGPILGKDGILVILVLLRPESAGNITLVSNDPKVYPRIIANYYTEGNDINVMVDGSKQMSALVNMPSLKKIGARLHDVAPEECDSKYAKESDEWWECYLRYLSLTLYHPCCTAAMGKDGDEMAVLDSRLRVRGIDGLRVADISVLPTIVSGNTNAPAIMIGEKVADFIKKEWSEKDGNIWKNEGEKCS